MPPAHQATVLLVEDDDISACVFEGLMEAAGVSVLRVRSAEQALVVLRGGDALDRKSGV